MRALTAALVAATLVLAPARAAELVMFEQLGCEWCEVWDQEVGSVFAKTDEGRLLALRKVDIDDPRPPDLAHIDKIRYTPTFVVIDRGAEVGRIVGYPGEAFFYGFLGDIINKL